MTRDRKPPKNVRFVVSVVISVVLAILGTVVQYVHITASAIPSGFVILLVGYLVLLAANLLRGVRPDD